MMQVLANPTDIVFRKSQHEYASLVSGHVCDIVTVDGDEIVGYLLLEVQKASSRLHMKPKGQIGYVTFNGHHTTRGAIDTLAARLNLAVDWEAMGEGL